MNAAGDVNSTLIEQLAPTELLMLVEIALGRSDTAIARHMDMPRQTATARIKKLIKQLGVANRAEASDLFLEQIRMKVNPTDPEVDAGLIIAASSEASATAESSPSETQASAAAPATIHLRVGQADIAMIRVGAPRALLADALARVRQVVRMRPRRRTSGR